MKQISLFLILFLFSYFVHAQACDFQQRSALIRNFNYQGAEIDMLFSSHTTGFALLDLNDIEARSNNSEELTTSLKDYLNKWKNLSDEQIENYQNIKNTIENENVSWLGVEFSNEELEKALNFHDIARYERLEQNLRERFGGILNADELERLLFLSLPAEYIYFSRNPDKVRDIRIVPLDDTELKRKTIEETDKGSVSANAISALFDRTSVEDRQRILEYLGVVMGDRRTTDMFDEAKAKQIIGAVKNPLLRSHLQQHMDSERSFIMFQRQRDAEAAKRIISQQGNGFVIFGSDHAEGIENHIKKLCLNASRPQNPSSVPESAVE